MVKMLVFFQKLRRQFQMRDVYIVHQHSCIEFMVSKGEQELPFYLCFEIGQIAKSEMECI